MTPDPMMELIKLKHAEIVERLVFPGVASLTFWEEINIVLSSLFFCGGKHTHTCIDKVNTIPDLKQL